MLVHLWAFLLFYLGIFAKTLDPPLSKLKAFVFFLQNRIWLHIILHRFADFVFSQSKTLNQLDEELNQLVDLLDLLLKLEVYPFLIVLYLIFVLLGFWNSHQKIRLRISPNSLFLLCSDYNIQSLLNTINQVSEKWNHDTRRIINLVEDSLFALKNTNTVDLNMIK